MIISRIDSCSFYSYSKQLRLISDSDDLSWTREQILFLDSSRLVTTRLPLSLSRCRTKVIFREFTEVYAVTKSPSPPHISPLTQQWSHQGGEVLSIERPAILNSFPQRAGEKSSSNEEEIERPRVLLRAVYDSPNAKRDGTRRRGSLSWNEHRGLTWLREIISA